MGRLVDLSWGCHRDTWVQRHQRRLENVLLSSMLTVTIVVQLCFDAVVEFPARLIPVHLVLVEISYGADLLAYSFLQLFQLFPRLKQVVLLRPPLINVVLSKRGSKAEIVA
jgi:hypothetical protein